MDTYRIDSHKLAFHPERVADWLNGRDIYPIYVEIAPCGSCNHRCMFCALDYLGYKPVFLETSALKKFLTDISRRGVKSIMFAGEGEPLLHKDIAELIAHAKAGGLDISITSNGVLLSKDIALKILPHLSWFRISLNAGTRKTYAAIHGTKPEDFDRVIDNIKEAAGEKESRGHRCTLGVQFLLLNENYDEVTTLAGILKEIGADYLTIKPYSQHPSSINRLKTDLDYGKLLFLENELKKYVDDDFRVIFRKRTMLKIDQEKTYRKCYGLPFWAYLSSKGDLYACSAFLGDERFRYGNIYKEGFEDIWKGEKRKKVKEMMDKKWRIEDCREVCRLDEINRYLWDLKNPPEHVNFI
ncbi:MAG: radical SAM protein [Candidatus Omnitrophica bacterium]|nr:radical SAM protein [Candidatus Omnitrophota bacterium]